MGRPGNDDASDPADLNGKLKLKEHFWKAVGFLGSGSFGVVYEAQT